MLKQKGRIILEDTKLCVVDSKPFKVNPKAATFEERLLCEECRKRWEERDNIIDGYRKDV